MAMIGQMLAKNIAIFNTKERNGTKIEFGSCVDTCGLIFLCFFLFFDLSTEFVIPHELVGGCEHNIFWMAA